MIHTQGTCSYGGGRGLGGDGGSKERLRLCCWTMDSTLYTQTSYLQTFFDYFQFLFVQVLTEEFRMTYCRLWQALINKDLPAVKRYSEQLNAGQLYRLLASMVCARAWDSITAGIDQEPMSKKEVLFIIQQYHFPTVWNGRTMSM